MAPMQDQHWQLRLVGRSLKKKEKIRLLDRHLPIRTADRALDLGCAQGILSFFLRKKGGHWISADLDAQNLQAAQGLLEKNLLRVSEGILPFQDRSLDVVVSLDYLEHLEDDRMCLAEITRVLKAGGRLLLAVPRTGFPFVLNRLRPLLGMRLSFYGHKREGYRLREIRNRLQEAGLRPLEHRRFSGFITEFMELMLNFVYIRLYGSSEPSGLRDGHIRPATAEEFAHRRAAFRFYSTIYPLLWVLSRVDKLIFWQRGYGLMLWAVRPEKPDA